jgi:transposase
MLLGMRAYSQDLRERILRAIDQGMPKAEAARTFQLALSTVKEYVRQWEETGSLAAGHSTGRPRAIPPDQHAALVEQLRAEPGLSAVEQARRWNAAHQTAVQPDTFRHTLHRLGWRFKKKRWWPPSGTLLAV